jgi:tetratricopeptide (TPR) repeat protein
MTLRIVAALLVCRLACHLVVPADEIDEQIDAASVLARSGKIERALDAVTALSVVHPEDPRVYYHRYLLLKKLDRLNEAADALERAEATLESWRTKGLQNESIAALKAPIEQDTKEFLGYRRDVRKILGNHREKAITIAKRLSSVPEEPFVLSILEEVYRADPSVMDDLLEVWGRTSIQSRATFEERQEKLRKGPKDDSASSQKLLKENLVQAEKALEAKDPREARISALAALELYPRHAPALVLLAEALSRLDRTEESALAGLLAIDAPKEGGGEATRELYARAFKQLHSPELRSYAELKGETGRSLLALRDRAREAKRPHDEEWIERAAARLSPGDPTVSGAIDPQRLSEEIQRRTPLLGNSKPTLGYVNLLAMTDLWRWRNRTEGSILKEGVLSMTPHDRNLMVQVVPKGVTLAKSFSLKFKLRYEIKPQQEPWIYIEFEASPKSGHVANAVILFPESDHKIAFASQKPNQPWKLRSLQGLPRDKALVGEWTQFEIRWNGAGKKLTVAVDGEPTFSLDLDAEDTLHGSWDFGLGGAAIQVEFKDVLLKNQE